MASSRMLHGRKLYGYLYVHLDKGRLNSQVIKSIVVTVLSHMNNTPLQNFRTFIMGTNNACRIFLAELALHNLHIPCAEVMILLHDTVSASNDIKIY